MSFARYVSGLAGYIRFISLTLTHLLVLKTGLTPSASGSAYLELEERSLRPLDASSESVPPTLKLTCTVHGPRPLPRSAPFTPNILLSTHVKFAPFASRQRRGYLRDSSERDLAVHLETALRGIIISDRWPKSGVEVIITVLEGEDDTFSKGSDDSQNARIGSGASGMMSILAGCITVASTAIANAGIDCIDLASGGVAALIHNPPSSLKDTRQGYVPGYQLILDPCPLEHPNIIATCVVGYLKSLDEVTELWINGDIPSVPLGSSDDRATIELLIESAVQAAASTQLVMIEALKEAE